MDFQEREEDLLIGRSSLSSLMIRRDYFGVCKNISQLQAELAVAPTEQIFGENSHIHSYTDCELFITSLRIVHFHFGGQDTRLTSSHMTLTFSCAHANCACEDIILTTGN